MSNGILFLKTRWDRFTFPCVLGLYGRHWTIRILYTRQNRFTGPLNYFPLSDWSVSWIPWTLKIFFVFSFTPRECFVCKGHNQWNREKYLIMTEYSHRIFLDIARVDFSYLQGLSDWFHEPKLPSQGLFSLPVKERLKLFISLFYFFFVLFPQNLLKMHLKNHIKINFWENLFSWLDKILDFFWNNFSPTLLNFAKSGKINSRKALFR